MMAAEHSGHAVSHEELRAARVLRHGEAVQQKLENARVAIAGLGGLGSNVAFFLTRIGVGQLHLIDFDKVDLTNLNRQQYGIAHLGRNKTDALAEELRAIDPYIDLRCDAVRITEENAAGLLAGEPIVCEAFDAPEAKAMLVNFILEHCPEKYIVAASGMAGFGDSNAIRTRRVGSRLILCGDGKTGIGEGCGLMAPRVAIAAAHEANAVVSLILGKEIC